MLEFSQDSRLSRVRGLADELFEHVLYDEEPLFVSDEATLWAVSMGDIGDVLERCRRYYRVPVTLEETRQPLWKLLEMLDERRRTARS